MSDYIVSARKYRPDSFETLIGQDNIARTLKNSIVRGKLAHAYLFCGPRGVGKTSTARIFAKTINCAHPTADMEPCGECESCKSFAEGRSYCIYELDAASNNSVEDIKVLMDKVQIPPQTGRYSVYIIDEVHMLSQAAFNAFLKTLEEPPAHAIFILATTEKHKILPTILSRCQTYDFNRITISDMVKNLRMVADKEGINVDDESLHVIAMKADGAMRDALTIFDQTVAFCGTDIHYEDVIRNLNVLDYEYSFRLVDAFLSGDHGTALTLFDEVLDKGFNALHFVASLSSHLRNLVVSQTAGLDSLLDLPDSLKARYKAQADRCTLPWLYEAMNVTMQCESGYKAAVNQRLHIEFALMKLAFMKGVPASQATAAASPQPAPAPAAVAPKAAPAPAQVTPLAAVPAPKAAPAAPAQASQPAPAAPAPAPKPAAPAPTATAPAPVPAPEKAEKPAAEEIAIDIELDEALLVEPVDESAPVAAVAPAAPASAPAPALATASGSSAATAPKPAVSAAAPAPASAPAPAAATAPAQEAPTPRRRSVKGAASLSMASLMGADEAPEAEEKNTAAEENALPSDDAIKAAWPALVAANASRPRLANALKTAKLSIKEELGKKILTFEVTNEAQKAWIESNLLRNLEGMIQDILKSGGVQLSVIAAQYVEVQVPYTAEEKARDLMSKNEEVKNLITDFGLDTK